MVASIMQIGEKIAKWYRDARIAVRDVQQGIHNVIIWFPIIWEDRQWDHVFFLRMMRHKLSLMESRLREGYFEGYEAESDAALAAILRLDALIADEYGSRAHHRHEAVWGVPIMEFVPYLGNRDADIPATEKLTELKITYPTVHSEEDAEAERKHLLAELEIAKQEHDADFDALLKILRDHLEKWWD